MFIVILAVPGRYLSAMVLYSIALSCRRPYSLSRCEIYYKYASILNLNQ